MMPLKKRERIKYIDYMKAIAMILVVLGHINFANQEIKAWVYSFHMPAFFFATGLVLKLNDLSSQDLVEKIGKYFRHLMLPFFLWALIYAKFSFTNLSKIIYGSHKSLTSAGSLSSLWFLPVLYSSLLLLFTLQFVLKSNFSLIKKSILILILFLFSCVLPQLKYGYPWCINVSLVALAIVVLGNVMAPYVQKMYSIVCQKSLSGGVFCGVFAIVSGVGTLLYKYNIPPHQGYILMAEARYGNMALFIITFICGITLLLSISMFLDVYIKEQSFICRCLTFIGQNTLCIFVVHKPIILCFKKIFTTVLAPVSVILLVTTIGTILISSFFCLYIERYLPVLIGKEERQ